MCAHKETHFPLFLQGFRKDSEDDRDTSVSNFMFKLDSCFNELGQIPQQVSEDLTRSYLRDSDFCDSFRKRLGRLILPQRGWKFSNDLGG